MFHLYLLDFKGNLFSGKMRGPLLHGPRRGTAKLEDVLRLELDQPRATNCGSDDAVNIRQAKVLVVVDVEDLGLNVQHTALGDRREFVDRGVQLIEARSRHVVVWNVVSVIA